MYIRPSYIPLFFGCTHILQRMASHKTKDSDFEVIMIVVLFCALIYTIERDFNKTAWILVIPSVLGGSLFLLKLILPEDNHFLHRKIENLLKYKLLNKII